MWYLLFFVLTALLAIAVTPLVRKLANNYGLVDVPRPPRNLHLYPVAKLGGVAIFVVVLVGIGVFWLSGGIDSAIVPPKFLWGIMLGALVLVIGGVIDDKYNLPAKYLWIAPVVAALIVVFSGIGVGIKFLSNPFGAPIDLNFMLLGLPASGIFIFLWMLGMMFTTKFLDGLDGLVAGIGLIAGLTLFALSLSAQVNQPITATLAIILAGSLTGYLVYAFHPATIFLGEGGSLLIGFILGVLAVILGGKIATALLVMGIPILDVAWVIAQRLWYRKSPFLGDRLHLHFQLLDLGFSQKQTAAILYAISTAFGFTAVFLQSMGKAVALVVLFMLMAALILGVIYAYRRRQRITRLTL
ncbi:MAG TPA: MraY family glycosyltransferase [Candidatus Doudnabacteria bacterium]|nr:MraY family glycosyltransferase [Candidatus Doudnabacteria bacterium]